MNNMTALMSLYLRAYHFQNNSEHIFKDEYAQELLLKEEYENISENLSSGVSFFAPGFAGTKQEALRFIVDRQLSAPVLIRSAFAEKMLDNAVMLGTQQVVSFASGYDTFALRTAHESLKMFELDLPDMLDDKLRRIEKAGLKNKCDTAYIRCDLSKDNLPGLLVDGGFDQEKLSFGSLLGFSYYLDKSDFKKLIGEISALWCEGSAIVFDYPMTENGDESERTRTLAEGANEKMKAKYTYREIESLLADCGFLIYEHHDEKSATKAFCESYNQKNPQHKITAPKGVGYVLAVKKR
ncbi:MAG: class I SAM-dependent methyltransferase [Acutalibacteraceae bacterium]